jgi:beta-1,4-mannosyltransferase
MMTFSWRRAVLGRYDVLHLHWPEHLIRSTSVLRGFAKCLLTALLLVRLRFSRIVVVRTVHNIEPHEAGAPYERHLFRVLDARTAVWIALNEDTPLPLGESVVIPHGHYRHLRKDNPRRPTPGRLLFFGLIRPYKGIEHLLAVFASLPSPELSLRIVGFSTSPELDRSIRSAAQHDPRISHSLGHASDDDLSGEIDEAELVVLPYRQMHNSGALLLALSLDRPVLAPVTGPNVALRQEVGEGWLHLYDGPLTDEVVTGALASLRENYPSHPPELGARDWTRVGTLLGDAYRRALATRG